MEENMTGKNHRFTMMNCRTATFTGVLDVLSFDVSEILLETEMGMLHIKGKDLHVNRLHLEKGEADLEGQIRSFEYSPIPVAKKRGGLFSVGR